MKLRKPIYMVLMSILLMGCSPMNSTHKSNEKEATQILNQAIKSQKSTQKTSVNLTTNLVDALYPTPPPMEEMGNEKRFDINVKEMPINTFFTALMANLNQSVVVSPELSQTITLSLQQTDLSGVLSALHDIYGIEAIKTQYGYRISPPQLETKIFTLNYLNLTRSAKDKTSVSGTGLTSSSSDDSSTDSSSSGGTTGSVEISTSSSNNNFWRTTQNTIKSIIGLQTIKKGSKTGARVDINPQTGIIIVTAMPKPMKKVAKFIQYTQNIMNRQVMIEAKILEVSLNKGFKAGIDWKALGFTMATGTGTYTYAKGMSRPLETAISLLSTEGKVTVLSSPRVITMNNQQALLEVGTTEYYVTNASSGTTPISGSTATLSSNVDLKPFFSGISLSVLPQINENGDITLYIHPSVSKVTSAQTDVTLSKDQNLVLPTAKSDIRETDSLVRVRSGQVIVLGGLMQSRADTNGRGLPFFGGTQISTEHDDTSSTTELVILLKATIPDQKEWIHQLEEYKSRFSKNIKKKGA